MTPSHMTISPEESERYERFVRNHAAIIAGLKGPGTGMSLLVERIVVNHATGELVPFEGETGIEAVLEHISQTNPAFARRSFDGHLMELSCTVTASAGHPIDVALKLGAGGQVVCACGPSDSIVSLLEGLEYLERRIHVSSCALGCDYMLLSEGYNPLAFAPLDVPLVPKAAWTMLNAYLAQTGRYARDIMRCACSTRVTIHQEAERDAIATYKVAATLSPVLTFLTDNVRSFRGSGARRCPRMVRSVMWDEVDPKRCGLVPGTFDKDFSFEDYADWIEDLQPIMLIADEGSTRSTGKRDAHDVMEETELDRSQVRSMLTNAYPEVRLCEGVEIMRADSLRPRMAAGYAAFLKGILIDPLAQESTRALIGSVSAADVRSANLALRELGWDATVYGRNVGQLVDGLLRIARSSLSDYRELRILDQIAELWDVRMVPRDAFIHQEVKATRGW